MENQEELSFDKFWETYKEKILPKIKKNEAERLKLLKEYKNATILLIISIVASILFLCYIIFGNLPSYIKNVVPVFLLFAIIYTLATKDTCNKNYKYTIKDEKIRADITTTLGNLSWYKHNGVFLKSELEKSGLFTNYDIKTADDEFCGCYKNVEFKVSETELRNTQRGSGIYDYKGIIIRYKHNKKAKARVLITTVNSKLPILNKKYSNIFLCLFLLCLFAPFLLLTSIDFSALFLISISLPVILLIYLTQRGRELCIPKKFEKSLNKITLEDPKFNKRFNVYSSDEVEARYLVTPLFMEMLNDLETVFGTDKLKCSFFDDNLMIAIPTKKDLFEIGDLFTPCDSPKCILQFWRELSSIYKMIEYFKLNEKIFLN